MRDKSFYLLTISFSIPNIENPLISPNETPITTKLKNPSPDHQTTLQNSSNLTHARTDDLHSEMIALKSFAVNEMYMLKKNS